MKLLLLLNNTLVILYLDCSIYNYSNDNIKNNIKNNLFNTLYKLCIISDIYHDNKLKQSYAKTINPDHAIKHIIVII